MLKRRIKTLLKLLLALVILLLIFLLFERIRGQISLARYKRELAAKGEKLTFRELVAPIPQGENGAPEILEAINRLQKGSVVPDRSPSMMIVMPSGRAIVGFRESEWIEDKITNRWEQLATDLKTNEATLAQIRLALEKPVLNNKLDYSQGLEMRFDHLARTKKLTFWLRSESQLALHVGKPHGALDSLLAQIRLPRLCLEDRILISELVRIAIAAIAKAATWEALQADGWTDDDLAQIQQAWNAQDFIAAMTRSLEGERVFGETSYEQVRSSNEEVDKLLFWQDFFSDDESHRPWWRGNIMKALYGRVWRFAWSGQGERHYLEEMQRLLETTRAAVVKKSFADVQPVVAGFDKESTNKNFYDKLRYPDVLSVFPISRGVSKALRAETERSVTVCAVALQRYSIRYGKSPVSLDSLVPEFLSSVPVDYMDGKPMKYRLNTDGTWVLYSVGEDGTDDGGDMSPTGAKATRNLWRRADYVWPPPALLEEVEAYRKEAARN